jgi:serine/threonine protein kinase
LQDKGLTKTGTKMGTIYYMSPEQIKAAKDIDHRTDIYSIGVTLYEMLSGRIPFNVDTDSDFEIMNEIVTGEIKDPREIYSHISDWIVEALFDAVKKDRDKRLQSAEELMNRMLSKGGEKKTTSNMDITAVDEPKTTITKPTIPVVPNKQQLKPPTVAPPVKPEKKAKEKTSATKFAIIGGAAAVSIIVLFFVLTQSSSDTQEDWTENWPVSVNGYVYPPDQGYYEAARQDFSKDDLTLEKSTNWQATAVERYPAY